MTLFEEAGVVEKYVSVIQDRRADSKTMVECAVGLIKLFNVKVGLRQASAPSLYFFATVMH